MKALGIVFSNIYDDYFGELTSKRTVASLPFGGRYRFIDFVLSNMSNSGIYRIGVITKYNYRSLMDHLGSCQEWDLVRKNEGLVLLPPFAGGNTGVYKGKLEALYTALPFIEASDYDTVVLSDSANLCNIDYRKAIETHIESGADITAIVTKGKTEPCLQPLVFTEEDGKVKRISIDCETNDSSFVGMGMFVIGRKLLAETTREAHKDGYVHFERDFMQKKFNAGEIKIALHVFDGVVLRNRSVESYFKNNLNLLDPSVRKGLFEGESPIYTKVRDEIPSYYADGSKVENSLAADGCTFRGHVSGSVIFRGVCVEKGASLNKCIVMQDSVIEEGAVLENVILDKDVRVTKGTILKGTEEHPLIIEKGATV